MLNQGYLVRERLIQGDLLAQLRAALDEVAEAAGGREAASANSSFSGLFVRGLLGKHPTFLEMRHFAPLRSVARALLGPKVQVHDFAMRVSYPGASSTGVEWHIHQRDGTKPSRRRQAGGAPLAGTGLQSSLAQAHNLDRCI